MSKRVLVTGGAGFIGSHTSVELAEHGYEVVILDDFSNAHETVIDRIRALTRKRVDLVRGSILDTNLEDLLPGQFDSIVHFAALKSVSDSIEDPLTYHRINVGGTVNLLQFAHSRGIQKFVFSSSATVYGIPRKCPVDETAEVSPINPYGHTKLVCEQVLKDYAGANRAFKYAILRYFNPAGAHESALIGEAPSALPSNLFPALGDVVFGGKSPLRIFGDDYETRDGTGVRDYIHVMDLAEAHRMSLVALDQGQSFIVNVGTGLGYSVKEVVDAFEAASGVNVPVSIEKRRPGDAAEVYADCALSREVLGWSPGRGLTDMCESSVNWYRSDFYNA